MRAAIFDGPGSIHAGTGPIRSSRSHPMPSSGSCWAGVRVGPLVLPRRFGASVGSIGHEFIGVVEAVGDDVTVVRPGDLVIAPFIYSDGTCPHCQNGVTISCVAGGSFGNGEIVDVRSWRRTRPANVAVPPAAWWSAGAGQRREAAACRATLACSHASPCA
jgi:threonine dehydrogenase-like Zn-dependent dehydrogenase